MKDLAFYATFFVISVLIVAAAVVERSRVLLLLGMVLVGLISYFYLKDKKKGG
ncbi:MAG: hypothetical protein HY376_02870 [Candidatus Blackburnbacteria bacterium]|nr:hypothetical protein [Candidatus Blackburnbacteria bacterium]